MKKEKLPLSVKMVSGAIGKKYVIKHYAYGIVKTKFPDMRSIEASPAQLTCRNNFTNAVAFAKSIYSDPLQKAKWQARLKVKSHLFNALVTYHCNRNKLV